MLGQRLKQARIEAGLSQRQLCGEEITRNMLSLIESGKAKPSMQTLTYLAQALGKPVGWFLDEPVAQTAAPEQTILTVARSYYTQGAYDLCLKELEKLPESEQLPEGVYLKALCHLALAKQAIHDGKRRYGVTLLEKAGYFGAQTVYFTEALERERILLLSQAQPENAGELARLLPKDDRELLLRARGFLITGDWEKCIHALSALEEKDARYHYLMGNALLGQKQYAPAAEHFLQAEQAFPQKCAKALETCYRELQDYKMAYHYACKQRIE